MKRINREQKNKLKKIFYKLKFKSLNLDFSKQLVLIGSIVGFISLFIPWINDTARSTSWNSFNSISGNIGFLLSIILILPIFVIFSTSYKEKLKLYSDLSFKNHFIIITSAIFLISFSIIALSFINGLNTYFESTSYGKGVILCMTAGIIVLIGGLQIRKEYYKNSSEIILDKLNKNREELKKEDNMKLPF